MNTNRIVALGRRYTPGQLARPGTHQGQSATTCLSGAGNNAEREAQVDIILARAARLATQADLREVFQMPTGRDDRAR